MSALAALPPDLLAAVANQLGPGPDDRLSLAAASRALLAASCRDEHSWWQRLQMEPYPASKLNGLLRWLSWWQPAIGMLQLSAQFPLDPLRPYSTGGEPASTRAGWLLAPPEERIVRRRFRQQNPHWSLQALPRQFCGLAQLQSLSIKDGDD
ncbi:hypothetical protein ABPG75_008530 [Micractinium tetrahymenae]